MSTEYEKAALARTLEFERGTWRADLREHYSPWFDDLAWGFQCHDGWWHLIANLTEEIAVIVGGSPDKAALRVVQVKEKFGCLRYYAWHVPEEHREAVFAAVKRAEVRSAEVCEVCGAPGQLGKTGGYVHTACPEHRDPKLWRPL